MKKIAILALAILITCFSFTRGAKNTTITKVDVAFAERGKEGDHRLYDDGPIGWDEFLGQPDTTSPWDAMLFSGISLQYEYKKHKGGTKVNVLIAPYMNTARSWVKSTGLNEHTLLHEQRHFDITAIVARKLADNIRNTVFQGINFKATVAALHADAMRQLEQLQLRYDEETAHGYLSSCQQEWNQTIDQNLEFAVAQN